MSRRTPVAVIALLAFVTFHGTQANAQVDKRNPHSSHGLVASRDPLGGHGAPFPYTEMAGTALRMRKGVDDHLIVEVPIASVPSDWKLTVH